MTTERILAIDPGLRELGFAVLEGKRLLAAGVRPIRLLPREARRREARRLVRSWLATYAPDALVIEATYGHPVPWLQELSRLARSVERQAKRRRLTVVRYAPQSVRKTVAGYGWATKRETAEVVVSRFPGLRVYLTQDRKWKERYWLNLFDAVALALHHQHLAATTALPSRRGAVRRASRLVERRRPPSARASAARG